MADGNSEEKASGDDGMNPINNTVTIPEGAQIKTIRPTMNLRQFYRYGSNVPPVLQQAWEVVETGEYEWRDVPSAFAEKFNG
jgi:hypothetical protein